MTLRVTSGALWREGLHESRTAFHQSDVHGDKDYGLKLACKNGNGATVKCITGADLLN